MSPLSNSFDENGKKKHLENGGIDPPTSHMLSERSTIWANSPDCFSLTWNTCYFIIEQIVLKNKAASSGNRTRAARVAGEHSTTEPTMLAYSVWEF